MQLTVQSRTISFWKKTLSALLLRILILTRISTKTQRRTHGCPLRGMSQDASLNRIIEVNHHLRLLKEKARELLLSEEGITHRKKRCADVEPVFGNIKCNKGFKRFMLRGCEKVEIEAGLLSIAHNLRKWSC